MQITITPNDIIERCLWTEFRKFCLKDVKNSEIENIVKENKTLVISENDAYVIGLLKIVNTDNLVHRFKQHINELLDIRSIIFENGVYINKTILMRESLLFKDRFPVSYEPDISFRKSLQEMNDFINLTVKEFEKLEVIEIERKIKGQLRKYNCIKSTQIAKLVKY